jgi:hypothetical protein
VCADCAQFGQTVLCLNSIRGALQRD